MVSRIKAGYKAIRRRTSWNIKRDGRTLVARKKVNSWNVNPSGSPFMTSNTSNRELFSKFRGNSDLSEEDVLKLQRDLKGVSKKDWDEARKMVVEGKMKPEEYRFAKAVKEGNWSEAIKQRNILANKPWHYGLSGKQIGRALYLSGATERAYDEYPDEERRELDSIIRRADRGY